MSARDRFCGLGRNGAKEVAMTVRRTVLAAALAAAVLAPSARADGGGASPGVYQGPSSLVDNAHGLRYATVAAGFQTVVEQIRTHGGAIARLSNISADFGLPLVTWNGDLGGLSADGNLLVLSSRPNGGSGLSKTSRFLVLDARSLSSRRTIMLRGDFMFDALSPDGKTLYLIQHNSARNLQRYRVRAYDLARGALRRGAIVDRSEPNMSGTPYARTATHDGAWVYTLYFGGKEPFIHALDTVHGRALCLDLDWSSRQGRIWQQRIELTSGGTRLAFVDRRTGKRAKQTFDLRRAHAAGNGSGTSWAAATASGITLAGAAALLLWSRGRRRRAR
jgi:hypothetical protein